MIEVLAAADLHFVYIDGEHGCFDWRDIEAACITAETPRPHADRAHPRPVERDRSRAFSIAACADSWCRTSSPSTTRSRVIDAAYFAPAGSRSFGAGRPEYGQRIGSRPTYMQACNAAISLCVMIESQRGLDIAADVAALPRVDYLSFGMLDLAQSLGHPGDPAHSGVKAAVGEMHRAHSCARASAYARTS